MGEDRRGYPETSRRVEPPAPVWLHPGRAWPPRLGFGADTPLLVRAGGLDQAGRVQGWLSEWIITQTGQWLAVVTAELVSQNGKLRRRMTVLVPAAAIEPRGPQRNNRAT